jgi:WD40 repeat protein
MIPPSPPYQGEPALHSGSPSVGDWRGLGGSDLCNLTENWYQFTPDSQTVVIQTRGDKNESFIEIWRTNGDYLTTFQNLGNINHFSIQDCTITLSQTTRVCTDKNTLVVRKTDHTLIVVKIDGKTRKTIKGKGDFITNVRAIPNSDKIAITDGDDTVNLWQIIDKQGKKTKLLKTFQGHNNQVNRVSISPDGKLIASASDDNTVKLWQTNGTVINTFEEHGNGVTSVTFSPDGKMLASGSKDNSVIIRSLDSKEVKPLAEPKILKNDEPITSVSFSPDSKMIAGAGETKVNLWDIDGNVLTTFQRLGVEM